MRKIKVYDELSVKEEPDPSNKSRGLKTQGGFSMKIKKLKKGDFFTLKELPTPTEAQVYIRGEYDRETKKYECSKFDDVNTVRYFKGDKNVFTDMIF